MSPVKLGKGLLFATGKPGYCTLSFYNNGEMWIQFWELNADGTDATLVFQKKIKDQTPATRDEDPNAFREYETHASSTIQPVTIHKLKPSGNR